MRKDHPVASPDREKRGKRTEDQAIVPTESAPPWAVSMQQTIMDHVSMQVQGMKAEVDEAKALAMEAQEQVRDLRKEIQELRESRSASPATLRSLRSLEAEFKQLKASTANTLGLKSQNKNANAPPDLKSGGADAEKRARTVVFGTFPQETRSTDIKTWVDEVMKDAEGVEESFAFGRKFAERAGVRFVSSDSMWKYMTDNAGSHKHSFKDTYIYCNPDNQADPQSESAKRERAVRKLVRAIIETSGEDGNAVKQDIETQYRKGIVWWKDSRVGQWSHVDMQMHLLASGLQFQSAFDKLMQSE